jgi:ubiquinone/menaquinone biosynthesis C-methylase UbiE
MTLFTDQKHLKENQYKDSKNLSARITIHQRFSTNGLNWQRWVWEQLPIQDGSWMLEVGCGPGHFWAENKDRIPNVKRVVGDYSMGMVKEARAGIGGDTFVNLDAQAIPLPSNRFDLVIANHMLYHLPRLAQGLREMARVLKPGGLLCAATNGANHMREMFDLAYQCDPRFEEVKKNFNLTSGFNLGNAAELLQKDFARVTIQPFENALWVTEAKPIVDFLISGVKDQESVSPDRVAAITRHYQRIIDSKGGVHITKETGLVLAWKSA